MAPEGARRRFRPAFWPTVIALPALVVLLGLGTWQVQRLHWKEALIAEHAARLAAPLLSVAAVRDPRGDDRFRRVATPGIFRHDKEMLLLARTRHGRPGVHVITPLRLPGGGHVMIDRGWVPDALKDPARRRAGQATGVVRITGLVRVGGKANVWVPDNRPRDGVWHYVDVAAMAARARIAGAAPFYIVADPAPNPGGYPIGAESRLTIPNDHLQYAFTWYALAVVLAVIYLLYHRRRRIDGKAG